MISRKLPPLNALPSFVETASLGTTVLAAEKLRRSHGAVSKQIKNLEECLNVVLFERDHGRLLLSEKGRHYFDAVNQALSLLERATQDLASEADSNLLRVACPPVFAKRWLLPRLRTFLEKHPETQLHILHDHVCKGLHPTAFDVGITMTPEHSEDLDVSPLMSEMIFPVSALKPNQGRERAMPQRLIQTTDFLAHWDRWSSVLGTAGRDAGHVTHIPDYDVALAAATSGHGMMVARGQMIIHELSSGALFPISRAAVQFDTAYWLVQPWGTARPQVTKAFATFLRTEAVVAFESLKRHLPATLQRVHAGRGERPGMIEESLREDAGESRSRLRYPPAEARGAYPQPSRTMSGVSRSAG